MKYDLTARVSCGDRDFTARESIIAASWDGDAHVKKKFEAMLRKKHGQGVSISSIKVTRRTAEEGENFIAERDYMGETQGNVQVVFAAVHQPLIGV